MDDGNFLAARSGESHEEIAFAVERGIGDRMKVVGNGDCNLDGMGVADVVRWCRRTDRPRGRALGHAGHHEIVGADQDRAFDLAEAHAGAAEFGRTQALADDANLASGQSEAGRHRLDVRLAVDVLLPSRRSEMLMSTSFRRESRDLSFIRSPKCNKKMHDGERIKSRAQVVDHDAGALGKPLQSPDGKRLQNIEDTKKYKAREKSFPSQRDGDERDQLAGDFVDDDELRILHAGGARDQRGGGDADERDQRGGGQDGRPGAAGELGSANWPAPTGLRWRPIPRCRARA